MIQINSSLDQIRYAQRFNEFTTSKYLFVGQKIILFCDTLEVSFIVRKSYGFYNGYCLYLIEQI